MLREEPRLGAGPDTVPCDKIKVREVMETLLDRKIEYLHDAGRLTDARYFHRRADAAAAGLPPPPDAGPEHGGGTRCSS